MQNKIINIKHISISKILFVILFLAHSASTFANPELILPIGISGSGKSTWINSLPKDAYRVVSPDEIRLKLTGSISDQSKNNEVFAKADELLIRYLGTKKPVIFDATNLNTFFRRALIDRMKAKYPNLLVKYKIFEADPELSKKRIKADIIEGKIRSAVPDHVIDAQFEMYKKTLEDIKEDLNQSNFSLFNQ